MSIAEIKCCVTEIFYLIEPCTILQMNYFFYCCTVHFDNTYVLITNKCTSLLHI